MLLFLDKYFIKLFWLSAVFTFLIVCLRAFSIPLSHDEAATFYYYIQSDNYLPYQAHVYTNNHVLNSALANIFYHLFGSHRFVLRLPNVLSLLILCFGIFKLFKHLKTFPAKIILVSFFILTINFLDFFEMCRGYGLSLGAMVLGLSFLLDYFETSRLKHLLLFSVCWQLALAANLTLVILLTLLILYVFIFQIKNKLFLTLQNGLLHLFNLALLIFWLKFSFFYKESGMLDSGVGENYWVVTFQSLLFFLFGTLNNWIQILALILMIFIVGFAVFFLIKNKFSLNCIYLPSVFFSLNLTFLIIGYFLLKKILGVNYPEDRTGLFFYVFFVLSLVFIFDFIPNKLFSFLSGVLLSASLFYFSFNLNVSNFSSYFYQTIPKSIYDYLKNEQAKTKEIFTIGGHRVRELNFAFLNYRGNALLNLMDESEQMQMNCDYYFALKREKPYYHFFYDEVMNGDQLVEDKKWDRVLLKRKEKIEHHIFYESQNPANINGDNEFFDFYGANNTVFPSKNPLELEAHFTFDSVPKPFNAFFVFSISNSQSKNIHYRRAPLNWLSNDLNGKSITLKLTTGNLPDTVKVLSVHIWNIDKKSIKLKLNSLKIYQLKGKGVNFRIPTNFYPLIESITKKPLL